MRNTAGGKFTLIEALPEDMLDPLQQFQEQVDTALRGSQRVDAGSYYNYGPTAGSSGYGFRDLAGVMQVKNSGGSWVPVISAAVIDETHGGTNQTSYATGDMLYASATNTLAKLAGNTTVTKKFLTQTGSGSISAAPSWLALTSGDVTGALGYTPQTQDATLTALAAYNSNGLLTQTSPDTFTGRTIVGTTNRIGVSNGDGVAANPTIDISGSYVGQTSIVTLGTITTGTWTGSVIGPTYGGTGTSTNFTQGSVLFSGASGVYSQDNSNLFWDVSNHWLGIGTTTPRRPLDIRNTSVAQLRLTYTDNSTYAEMQADSAGNLIFSIQGSLVKFPNAATVQSVSYASQTTGWGITGSGNADFRYLYVDEMHAKSFMVDMQQALAGGQIVSKSVAEIAVDFTLPAASGSGTLIVKDFPGVAGMGVFVSGDIVRLCQFTRASGSLTIADAWGVVTSGVNNGNGTQSWTFTRSAGGNAGTATGTISAKTLALDYGTTGNGFYEVNAVDGSYGVNSPYWQTVTWTTHPQNGQVVRARGGNLQGITGVTEYGLYAGNGTGTSNKYLRITDQNAEFRNIPLHLYEGASLAIELNASGPYLALGNARPTSWLQASTTGIWMGNAGSSIYKVRVGTTSGAGALTSGWTWDGTNLSIIGSITITNPTTAGINYAGAASPGAAATSIVGQAATATSSDFSVITGATKPANNATVGATWGTNLSGIPTTLTAPSGSGLFLSSTNMGYYTGGVWTTYIDNSGNMILGNVSGAAGLSWNQGTGVLAVKGTVTANSGAIGGWLINPGKLSSEGVSIKSSADHSINYATNPGFESGNTGWTVGTGMVIVTDGNGHSGSWRLDSITANAITWNNTYADCAPGDIFYAEAWIKSTGGSAANVIIGWYDASHVFISSSAGTSNGASGSYALSTVTATPPATAVYARVGCRAGSGTAGWYFDDVVFTNLTTSSLAFGSTPPVSSTAGTGLYLDLSGMYGLLSSVLQVKFDATTGAILAGSGAVTLNSSGISLSSTSGSDLPGSLKWLSGSTPIHTVTSYRASSTITQSVDVVKCLTADTGSVVQRIISATEALGTEANLILTKYSNSHATNANQSWIQFGGLGSPGRGLVLSNFVTPIQPLADLDIYNGGNSNTALTDMIMLHNNPFSGASGSAFGTSMLFCLKSSSTSDQDAVRLGAIWTTATHASRTSAFVIQTVNSAAAIAEVARFGQGLQMGGPAGGDKGAGTINITGDIYKNNTAFTNPDFVLEYWATGRIKKFLDNDGAMDYKGPLPLTELRKFIRTNYCLPGFGQSANHGLMSGTDQLLLSLEEAYIHIFGLEDRILKLEGNTNVEN